MHLLPLCRYMPQCMRHNGPGRAPCLHLVLKSPHTAERSGIRVRIQTLTRSMLRLLLLLPVHWLPVVHWQLQQDLLAALLLVCTVFWRF